MMSNDEYISRGDILRIVPIVRRRKLIFQVTVEFKKDIRVIVVTEKSHPLFYKKLSGGGWDNMITHLKKNVLIKSSSNWLGMVKNIKPNATINPLPKSDVKDTLKVVDVPKNDTQFDKKPTRRRRKKSQNSPKT